jgi:Sulfotransferase family
MAQFDQANRAAFELCLGGRTFNRSRYSRILDSTISTFNPQFFRSNTGVGSSSRRPIFIVGMMRSGTTLLEQILSSHSEVAGGGELAFWLDHGAKAFDVDRRVVDLKRVHGAREEYLRVLGAIDVDCACVTDKMPQNYQVLGLIHLAFPKAPIVHIRRHPVDTCISIYTTPYQRSPDFAHCRDSIVFAYREYLRLMEHWRKVLLAHQFLEIDYEDLTSDPEGVTRRVLAFCGLTWEQACSAPEKNPRVVTTPSLCAVRQPINRSAVERWRVYEPWLGEFASLLPSTGAQSNC